MEQRICKECEQGKDINDFYRRTAGGHMLVCKKCHNDRMKVVSKKWRDDRKAKGLTTSGNRSSRTLEQYAAIMLRGAKRRAGERKMDFDLDVEWIIDKLKAERCEVTSIAFDMNGDKQNRSRSPWRPSLDRIQNDKGYTKDNVQAVVWIYNCAKAEWTHEEFMIMVRSLKGE